MSVSQRFARSWQRAWAHVGIAVRALDVDVEVVVGAILSDAARAWLIALALARTRNSRVDHWMSVRTTSSAYRCNVCGDALMDTDSARHFPTKHAQEAYIAHAREHLAETSRERTLARVLAGRVDIRDLEPDEQVALDAAMEGGR